MASAVFRRYAANPNLTPTHMRRNILLITALLFIGAVMAADSGPKDEIKAAAQKLAGKPNYSWKTTVESAGSGNFRPGPTDRKSTRLNSSH